jgi:hypothetical protein
LGSSIKLLLFLSTLPDILEIVWRPNKSRVVIEGITVFIQREINVNVVKDAGIDTSEITGKAKEPLDTASRRGILSLSEHRDKLDIDVLARDFCRRRRENISAGTNREYSFDNGFNTLVIDTFQHRSKHNQLLISPRVNLSRSATVALKGGYGHKQLVKESIFDPLTNVLNVLHHFSDSWFEVAVDG